MVYIPPTSSSDGPSYPPAPRQSGGQTGSSSGGGIWAPGGPMAQRGFTRSSLARPPAGTVGPSITDSPAQRYRYQDSGAKIRTNRATDASMSGWGNTVKPQYGNSSPSWPGPRYPRNRSGGNGRVTPQMNPAWKQFDQGFTRGPADLMTMPYMGGFGQTPGLQPAFNPMDRSDNYAPPNRLGPQPMIEMPSFSPPPPNYGGPAVGGSYNSVGGK